MPLKPPIIDLLVEVWSAYLLFERSALVSLIDACSEVWQVIAKLVLIIALLKLILLGLLSQIIDIKLIQIVHIASILLVEEDLLALAQVLVVEDRRMWRHLLA